MISQDQLRKLGIYSWADLENDFKNSNILLGNGFSRSLADTFNYESLFTEFLSKCPSEYANIFRKFDTTNFENIMEKLTYAKYVNELFDKQEPKIEEAARILQDGLITTIRDIHPKSEAIFWDRLETIANKMRFFSDIYTLNYDLFIYHIIMILKDQFEKNQQQLNPPEHKKLWQYSDAFYGEEYDGRFKCCQYYIASNWHRAIYYLHGALFIFGFGEQIDEMKLIRKGRGIELIELIGDTIKEGDMPVFVCEGSSDKKLEQIKSSSYLEWVYKGFAKKEKQKFVVFGCSLSQQQDTHIIDALDKPANSLAISLHIGEKTIDKLKIAERGYENKFTKAEVHFFDSETLFLH